MNTALPREVNTSSFIDMYFGECIWLVKDLKKMPGFKNKIKLLFMPPGWLPDNAEHTAAIMRRNFLKGQEHLGKTSRDYILEKLL